MAKTKEKEILNQIKDNKQGFAISNMAWDL